MVWWPFLAQRQHGQLEVAVPQTTPACTARVYHLCTAKVAVWIYDFAHGWTGKTQKKILLAQCSSPKEPKVPALALHPFQNQLMVRSPELIIVILTCWGSRAQRLALNFCTFFLTFTFKDDTAQMLSGGHWVIQAPKCDSSLRAVGRSCSSLPVEFAIILPPLRGLILDQSAVAAVFLISLPLSAAKPAVCTGVWLGTRGLNLIKLKSGYVSIFNNCSFLLILSPLPEWSWLLGAFLPCMTHTVTGSRKYSSAHVLWFKH